jgi:hypothetical protein
VQGSKYSSRGLSPEESAIDENEAAVARGMRSERADAGKGTKKKAPWHLHSQAVVGCRLVIRGPRCAELYLVQRMKSTPHVGPCFRCQHMYADPSPSRRVGVAAGCSASPGPHRLCAALRQCFASTPSRTMCGSPSRPSRTQRIAKPTYPDQECCPLRRCGVRLSPGIA